MFLQQVEGWLTFGLGPSLWAIFFTAIIAFTLPILVHTYIYRTTASTNLPAFLLIGPSGSGKTSLLTLIERGSPSATHVSQTPLSVECSLPEDTAAASTEFRSVNDPSNVAHRNFLLVDTPGHGKLRHFALESVVDPVNLRGIIFVVDATALSTTSAEDAEPENGLAEAAEYLYDILLTLQKKHSSSKSAKGPADMPFLIAPNKLDLFTALPAKLVKSALEAEITKLRRTRSKGLLDSGVGMDDDVANDPETLGGDGEGKFEFSLMEEYNIPIEIVGGNVLGADGSDIKGWWNWMAKHL